MRSSNIHRFLVLTASGTILLSAHSPAQDAAVRESFYRLEQQSWREYIDRFPDAEVDSTFDVRFYDIDVDIRIDSPYIEGRVRCDFDAVQDGLDRIRLNLHHALEIDSLTGNVSGFTFGNDTIFVDLDRPYASGESAQLTVHYRGEPELAGGLKGLHYTSHGGGQPVIASLSTPFLAHYWWPCKDGPGDKPDSVYIDIAIPDTVISGYELIASSNGILDGVIARDGKKVFRWRERSPIVPYYVMVAISNYRSFQQVYAGEFGESFPIDYYVFDEHYAAAQQGVARIPEVMGLFSSIFGAYPFDAEKYGMTQLGFYGAIENQTNIIQNSLSLSWFDVSVHELAHMWFADMITCRDWHHGWLNEGFATYAEALWAEHSGGIDAYRANMSGNEFYGGGTLYLQEISDPFGIFLTIIYEKGAYVLHMLRGVMGDDAFFEALDRYAQTPEFRYDHAVTEDFQRVCEEVGEIDLDVFFDQWIYDEYYPSYEYGFWQNPVTHETRMTIEQIQESLGRRPVFEMPVPLQFEFDGGADTLVTVWNDARVQTFDFAFAAPVRQVILDPDRWILREASPVGIDEPDADVVSPRFVLEPNYPNPFNPSTTIAFSIPQSPGGWVDARLTIFDIRGRRVRRLIDSPLAAGNHRIAWDGRDDRGREAASGVYIYTLEAGESSAARKMMLVK
jgi:aminopeptidase N